MSGEKYVSTPPASRSSSVKSGPDLEIAAAAGKVIVGTAAVAAVGAGLAVYGACKGAAAVTKWGVKKYSEHKAKEAAAEQSMNDNLKKVLKARAEKTAHSRKFTASVKDHLGSYSTPVKTSGAVADLEKYAGAFSSNSSKAFASLEKTALAEFKSVETAVSSSEKPDLSALADECMRITQSWEKQRKKAVEENFAASAKRIDSAAASIRNKYDDMQRRINAAVGESRQQEIKLLAQTAFGDAVKLLELLASTPGTAAFEAQSLCDLTEQMDRAHAFYKNGDYNRCFALSSDVFMQGKEVLKDVLVKHERCEVEREKLTCGLAEIIESINSLDKVKFTHKGTVYKESLLRYCPDGFENLKNDANEIICSLHDDMSDFELHEAAHKLEMLNANYKAVYRFAWEKAIGSYKAYDCSQRIAAQFFKQGYEPEDYKFEGGVEGEKLHVNFVNRSAGSDRVTLVLDIGSKGADAVLHQYGSQTSRLPDTALQHLLGEIVKREVEKEMGVGASMQSKNEGGFSKVTEAADLEKQQAKKQQFPYRKT